jgi:molecular chaperone DnaJ
MRVRGRGVSTAKGAGDLLVTVEVSVPQKLSSTERKAVEALAAASDGASPREHFGV